MTTRHILGLAVLLASIPANAWAENSNQSEVRASLERDGWRVAYGRMITEKEYWDTSVSIVESVYLKDPQPFIDYITTFVDSNVDKIAAQIPGVARADLIRWFDQSVRQNNIVTFRNLELNAGFATYQRWQEWTHPTVEGWPPHVGHATEKTPLPNWQQFYVRYRLVGGTPQLPGSAATRFRIPV